MLGKQIHIHNTIRFRSTFGPCLDILDHAWSYGLEGVQPKYQHFGKVQLKVQVSLQCTLYILLVQVLQCLKMFESLLVKSICNHTSISSFEVLARLHWMARATALRRTDRSLFGIAMCVMFAIVVMLCRCVCLVRVD